MLRHRQDAGIFQTARISNALARHVERIFAKRPSADYGIARIAVDIDCRCEIGIDANQLAFSRHFLPVFVEQSIVLNRAKHHIFGKTWRFRHSHRQAPLAVEPDKHRQIGNFIDVIGQLGMIFRRPVRKISPSYMITVHYSFYLFLRRSHFRIRRAKHLRDKLADALFGRHRIVHRIDPSVHFCLRRFRQHQRCFGINPCECKNASQQQYISFQHILNFLLYTFVWYDLPESANPASSSNLQNHIS